jgi:DNA-binding MarR family transcriptional regulator
MAGPDRTRAALLGALERHLAVINELGVALRLDALVATELTLQQLKVLLLAVHRAPTTAHDVAEVLDVSAATVSGIVARLVEHGLLRQETAPHDGRVRHLLATADGERAVSELAWFQERANAAVLARLTDDELAALATGLAATERAMRDYVAEQDG